MIMDMLREIVDGQHVMNRLKTKEQGDGENVLSNYRSFCLQPLVLVVLVLVVVRKWMAV